jgi:hypothetical protein
MPDAAEMHYTFAPNASSRPSQSVNTNSRERHGMLARGANEFRAFGRVFGIEHVSIFNE